MKKLNITVGNIPLFKPIAIETDIEEGTYQCKIYDAGGNIEIHTLIAPTSIITLSAEQIAILEPSNIEAEISKTIWNTPIDLYPTDEELKKSTTDLQLFCEVFGGYKYVYMNIFDATKN